MRLFEKRGIKGAISIFLVIITIPTFLFAAVLVDGSRLASARAMTQEAADLAAVSALAAYNVDLKEDYGLFAMEDSSKVEEIYRQSLQATLLASGFSDSQEYSDRLWEILKSSAGAGNPYQDKSFLNLYDFSIEDCTVTPAYSLAEWQVLENQMVEHAKFRGLFVMMNRLGWLKDLDAAQNEAANNKETAAVMQDKMEVDEENAAVDQALENLRTEVEKLKKLVEDIKTGQENYLEALKARMVKTRLENIETTEEVLTQETIALAALYETRKQSFKNLLSQLDEQADGVLDRAEQAREEVSSAVANLNEFKNSNSGKAGNSSVAELISEADRNIEDYNTYHKAQLEEFLQDSLLNQMKEDHELGDRFNLLAGKIEQAVDQYAQELAAQAQQQEEEQEEEDPPEEDEEGEGEEEEEAVYYFYYLDGIQRTEDLETAYAGLASQSYKPQVEQITRYFITQNIEAYLINPSVDAANHYQNTSSGGSKIDKETAKNMAPEQGSSQSSQERGEVPEAIYNSRPSKTFVSQGSQITEGSLFNEDGDLSKVNAIMEQGQQSDSMIQQVGEVVRDDVLSLSYIFGTFKTRMSTVDKFSASGMSQAEKNSFYMPEWRYAYDEGELDMRFSPKKENSTVLRGEVEYLIFGNRTDSANEDSVYAVIFAERLVNNMVAVYGVESIRSACHLAGAVASAATAGVVPEAVFYWLFMAAWATAETTMDMDLLVNGGYKIPMVKTSKNVLLNPGSGSTLDNLLSMNKTALLENYGRNGLFVCYEDYLLIMLLIGGREQRIMRTADLVEMNMRQKQSDFTMAGAYTYLKASTRLSTRYLFGSVMPFSEYYTAEGVADRMEFGNEIYLGY